MLIVPEKFILLATPRTGSRALEQTFMEGISTQWDEHGRVRQPKEGRIHHVHPEDIEETAERFVPGSSTLPKYTVCRNPIDQLRSWYHHARQINHGGRTPDVNEFVTFIKEADISWYFTPTLNPYQWVADEIFPYERNGIITAYRISHRTGAQVKPKTEAPVIGASIGLQDTWHQNEEVQRAVKERFQNDIDLYESLVFKYDQP